MATNPKLYRELSVPFESRDAAEKAVDAFFKEVGELRKKYKIPDLTCIIKIDVVLKDENTELFEGEEGTIITSFHYGHELSREPMAAWALGKASADRQANVMAMASRSKKITNKEE